MSKRGQKCAVGAACAWLAAAAWTQQSAEYVERVGDYTVHYSIVPAHLIPERVEERHDLPSVGSGLLNIAVRERGRNVRARIDATAVNLAGQLRDIRMREVVENELISYLGVVDVGESQVLDFTLDILPAGAAEPFRIEFRERLEPPPPASLPPR